MAGKNVDPAEAMDVLDTIRKFGEQVVSAYQDMPVQLRTALFKSQSAPEYESRSVTLNPGVPIPILGYDLARTRALLRASVTDVFIGKLSQVSGGGLGYCLPTQAGDEIRTTDEIYVAYNPQGTPSADPVYVTVWAERHV